MKTFPYSVQHNKEKFSYFSCSSTSKLNTTITEQRKILKSNYQHFSILRRKRCVFQIPGQTQYLDNPQFKRVIKSVKAVCNRSQTFSALQLLVGGVWEVPIDRGAALCVDC